ncbi:hypothetical protein D3C85_1236070 [compost metagenome]
MTLRHASHRIKLQFDDAVAVLGRQQRAAGRVIVIARGLIVEAALFQQPADRVVHKARLPVILVGQRRQLTQLVPLIVQRAASGVLALGDQARRRVAPLRAPAQRVGVGQQPAFRVALEVFLGLIGVRDAGQLPRRVGVARGVACRVGELG